MTNRIKTSITISPEAKQFFEQHGIPISHAVDIAYLILKENPNILKELRETLRKIQEASNKISLLAEAVKNVTMNEVSASKLSEQIGRLNVVLEKIEGKIGILETSIMQFDSKAHGIIHQIHNMLKKVEKYDKEALMEALELLEPIDEMKDIKAIQKKVARARKKIQEVLGQVFI